MANRRSSLPTSFRPVAALVAMSIVAGVIAIDAVAPAPVGAVSAVVRVDYEPPVDAAVIDRFRPPEVPWGPGNRGIDYATDPGVPVRAAAGGEVVFAGQVGATLHVTIRHDDGLRTSYSFLADIAVIAGDVIERGVVVGTTSGPLHFGVRDPIGRYLDPESLFASRGARLVPGGDDGAVIASSGGFEALLDTAARLVPLLNSWDARLALPELARLGHATVVNPDLAIAVLDGLWHLQPSVQAARIGRGIAHGLIDQRGCTPRGAEPPVPQGRRIAVLVAGFGSTSTHGAIDEVDVDTLGYAADDVLRFSYRGGRVPRTPPPRAPRRSDSDSRVIRLIGPASDDDTRRSLSELPASHYDLSDSIGDLDVAAERLVELLERVAAVEPGVPIDLLAHSQGGIVARLALEHARRTGVLPDELDVVVTIGTPHGGADLASAASGLRATPGGRRLLDAAYALGAPTDPDSPALAALSTRSATIAALATTPPPQGIRARSIGARGDLVVAAPRSRWSGQPHAVISATGPSAHSELPGDDQTTTELALALAGAGPTCRTAARIVGDATVGEVVIAVERALGAGLAVGAGALG